MTSRIAARYFRAAVSLAALLVVSASAPAHAATDATAALAVALRGARRPFTGLQRSEVVTGGGRLVSTVRVSGDGQGRTRHEYRDGPAAGVVLLQSGRSSWQWSKDDGWIRLSDTVQPDAQAIAARIGRHYSVTVGAPETLLGRKALPIRIVPRQSFNPSRRMWLDSSTGILLKDSLYAPDGRLRSSTAYQSLSFEPLPGRLFSTPSSSTPVSLRGPGSFRPVASAAVLRKETGRDAPLPAHVPSGYAVVTYGLMTAGSGRLFPAVRYSDGIAAFTIFERGPGPRHGVRPRGGTHGMASDVQHSVTQVSTDRSNYLLIGDLSEDELRRVARSLP